TKYQSKAVRRRPALQRHLVRNVQRSGFCFAKLWECAHVLASLSNRVTSLARCSGASVRIAATLTRDRCGSGLRRTSPYSRPCRCESDPSIRKSAPGRLRCRTPIAVAQEKHPRYSRGPGTIAETSWYPNG